MPRRWIAVVLALASAGCLGPSAPEDPVSLPPDAWAALPCDAAVESERIRGREVDLASDPANPERLAAAYMASMPSTRAAPPDDEPIWIRVVRSSDGGATWQGADLPGWPGSPTAATSPFGGSAITGDPVVAFLPDGTLLLVGIMIRADYSYAMFTARFEGDGLEASDVVVFSRAAYGDARLNDVWSPGSVVYNDKEEVAVDPATGTAYVSWMWRANHPTEGVRSVPVVVMSTDGAKTWSDPHMIVGGLGGGLTSDEGHIGQFPFTTRDGQAHVVWYASDAQTLLVSSAPTGTLDFGEPRAIAEGVDLSTGAAAISLVVASVAVGPSADGVGESAYVAWSDSRSGDADVLVLRSDDGAATWTGPLRVNGQAEGDGTDQLVPVVAVSPHGVVGAHYISFAPAGDVYQAEAALSYDGGATFTSAVVSSATSEIARSTGQRGTGIQGHVGDYFGAAFSGDRFHAMWQDGREGTADEPYTSMYTCAVPAGVPGRAG